MLELLLGIAFAGALLYFAFFIVLPRPYYDFNKVCGQFREDNLEEDPYFFNPQEFEWVKRVEDNWTIIRDELQDYLKHNDLIPYFGSNLMSRDQCWSVLGLYFWGIKNHPIQKHFPKTMALMQTIPGFSLAAFSRIEPHSAITPHNGDTNANIRCHLGLVVPGKLPEIGFRVGNQEKSWEEGKVLMFCDAHRHTAFNNTDHHRIIFQFDVIRPKYAAIRSLVCARVLASICTQKIALKVAPFVMKSKVLLRGIYYGITPLLFVPIVTQIGSQSLFNFFVEAPKKPASAKAK